MSFIHRPEDQTIILILHVPFVEAEQLLPLYEFFSANISVVPDVGQADLIAIGDTETFQTLTSSDLASCRRLGQTFFLRGPFCSQNKPRPRLSQVTFPRHCYTNQGQLQVQDIRHTGKDF